MFSCSPTLSQISLKNSFGKVVFQILAQIEMTQKRNRLFGRHFEMVQHFQFFFCRIVIFYSPYMYGANFIAKFWWEIGFLKGGVPWNPPWAPTGVKVPWSLKGVLHPWALFWKTLCIFSKNKATSEKVSYGSGQKCSKELKNYSFTSVETIVVKLQWKMCENQYFPCFEP